MSSPSGTKSDLQSKNESAASSSRGMEMDTNDSSAAQNRIFSVQPKYLGKNMAKGRFSGSTLRGPDPKKYGPSPLPPTSLVSEPVVGTGERVEDEQPLYASGSAALDQWVSSSVESSGSGRSTSSRSTGSSIGATNTRRNSGHNNGSLRGSSSVRPRGIPGIGMHNVDPSYLRLMDSHVAFNDPKNESWE